MIQKQDHEKEDLRRTRKTNRLARVFTNDALEVCNKQGVDGRYEMILLAAHRARKIRESELGKGQRNTVEALREFERGETDFTELKDSFLQSLQTVHPPKEEIEE